MLHLLPARGFRHITEYRGEDLGHTPTFTHTTPSLPFTLNLGRDTSATNQGANALQDIPPSLSVPAIPKKLLNKILTGEYVDMAELRSDSWKMEELLYQTPPATVQGLGSVRPGRKPVTDILSWCECFTVMAAIITSRYPEKASQLFSYIRTIVRASQTFDGPAWVSYDSQFRASLNSWDWGIIDSGLYNECFTGRTKAKVVCTHCLSDSHQESQCPLTPGPQVSRTVPNQAS